MKYTLNDDIQYASDIIDAHINNILKLNIQDCVKYIFRISKWPLSHDIDEILKDKLTSEQELECDLLGHYDIISDPLKILKGNEFKFNSDNLSFEAIGDNMINPNSILRFKVLAALLDNFVEPKFDLPFFDEALVKLLDTDSNDTSLLAQDKNLRKILTGIQQCFESITNDDYTYRTKRAYSPLIENMTVYKELKFYIQKNQSEVLKTNVNDEFIDISEKILIAKTYELLVTERCLSDPYYYTNNMYDYNYLQYRASLRNASLFWDIEHLYNTREYRNKITVPENYDEYDLRYEIFRQGKKYTKERFIPKIISEEFRKYFVFQTCKYYRKWCCKKYENLPGDSPIINCDYESKLKLFEDNFLNYSTKRNSTSNKSEHTNKKKARTAHGDIYNPLLLSYKLKALQQGYVLQHCGKLLYFANYPELCEDEKIINNIIFRLNISKKKYCGKYKNKNLLDTIKYWETKLASLNSKKPKIENMNIQKDDPLKITQEWWEQCPFAIKDPEYYEMLNPENSTLSSHSKIINNKKIIHRNTFHCKKSSLTKDKTNCECLYKIPLEKNLSATEIAYILGLPTQNANGKRSTDVIRIERLLKKNNKGYAIQSIADKLYYVWGTNIINVLNSSRNQQQPLYNYETTYDDSDTYVPIPFNTHTGFLVNNYDMGFKRKAIISAIKKNGGLKQIFKKNKFLKFERFHLEELYKALKKDNYQNYIWLKIPYEKLLHVINFEFTAFKNCNEIPDFPIFDNYEEQLRQDLMFE